MCKTASPSEALVELIRTAGLEKTFAEFPEDVLRLPGAPCGNGTR